MKEELEYGPVLIADGEYKNRILYYDDDYTDIKGEEILVCYWGLPYHCKCEVHVAKKHATSKISTKYLVDRLKNIDSLIMGYALKVEKYSTEDIISYFQEYILCNDILSKRYFSVMNKLKSNEEVKIFISHSSKDMLFSRGLATDLLTAGYSVFLDDWSIDIGDRIIDEINNSLNSSVALIMVISKDYLQSVCCSDEWKSFYMKTLNNCNCFIYPLIIDNSKPPILISQLKYAKINNENYEKELGLLLKAINKHIS